MPVTPSDVLKPHQIPKSKATAKINWDNILTLEPSVWFVNNSIKVFGKHWSPRKTQNLTKVFYWALSISLIHPIYANIEIPMPQVSIWQHFFSTPTKQSVWQEGTKPQWIILVALWQLWNSSFQKIPTLYSIPHIFEVHNSPDCFRITHVKMYQNVPQPKRTACMYCHINNL